MYNTIFKGTEARGEGPIGWEHWKPSDQHPEVYPRPRRQKLRTGGPRVRPEVTGAPRLRQQCEQNQRGFGGYCIEAVETVFMLCFTLFSINNIYIFFYRMASKCRINKTPVVLKQKEGFKKKWLLLLLTLTLDMDASVFPWIVHVFQYSNAILFNSGHIQCFGLMLFCIDH